MRKRIQMRGVFAAGILAIAACVGADGAQAGEVWAGEWSSRFEETKEQWVLELPEGAGELEGTLRVGEASCKVKARREGAWVEATWTDADGCITQARGVDGQGEWRGLTISGGGGRMVAYGRFALKRKAGGMPPMGTGAPPL